AAPSSSRRPCVLALPRPRYPSSPCCSSSARSATSSPRARPSIGSSAGSARSSSTHGSSARQSRSHAAPSALRCAVRAELQEALVQRILAHLDARTTDTGAGPHRQPVASYVDPVRYAREVGTLFNELPLAIAHSSQLAHPGDFLTHDASGVPLLVVRRD